MRFSSISARYRDVELGVAPHAVLGHVETRRLDMLLDADSPERLHRPEAAERRGECEAADRGEPDGLHAEQAVGLAAVGSFTFTASFGCLWAMKALWGIRVEEHVETAGLDVAEHGMWGYPEFYIPVPGGYGTESHSHLVGHAHRREPTPLPVAETEAAA